MSETARNNTGGSDGDQPQRRERAAIAAQACQTCRTRKSKCDEQRPRCGLCQRLDVECHYREPLPTKKDKTLVHILEALARLETKFDNISGALPTAQLPPREHTVPQNTALKSLSESQEHDVQRYFTDAHAVVTWPSIYVHLSSTRRPIMADLPTILQRGTPWFTTLLTLKSSAIPSIESSLQSVVNPPRDGRSAPHITFPHLTIQQTQIYTDAYFHTFNVLHPILDQDAFTNDIATHVLRDGYAIADIESVIALLVFALGQLAMEGTLDEPVTTFENGRSGMRGGTATDPPGLAIFNEARKRMGFLVGQFTIADIQMRLLAATYYEAAGLHLDFWRSTLTASASCQLLVRSMHTEWQTPYGQALKRLFWTCYLNEMMCYFDLGLPPSELSQLQSIVPLPSAADAQVTGVTEVRTPLDDRSQHQHYFASLLALEKLIHEIHSSIIEPATQQATTATESYGPSMPTLLEMARRLESWRSLLPRPIQWLDSEMFDFPNTDVGMRRPNEPLFAFDQGSIAIRHRYNLDITTAHLRSRFYYARHLLYQPFIYKVLHFSETLEKDDVECATLSLKSAMVWPILMAPPKDKKRLIPYVFTWTQACMSTLLILEMTRVHDRLRSICEEHIDPQLISRTITLMLDWLRDTRIMDPTAEWSWQLLRTLFLDSD